MTCSTSNQLNHGKLSVSRVRGRDIGWFHGSLPSVPGDIQILRHGVRILLRGLSEAC